MDNAIRRQNKADTISPIHIWSHYGIPDIRTAGDDNLNKVIALWDVWPYDERAACEIDQSGDGDCGPYSPPAAQGSGRGDSQLQSKIKDSDSRGHWRRSPRTTRSRERPTRSRSISRRAPTSGSR